MFADSGDEVARQRMCVRFTGYILLADQASGEERVYLSAQDARAEQHYEGSWKTFCWLNHTSCSSGVEELRSCYHWLRWPFNL